MEVKALRRNLGTTSAQMKAAPPNAHFVWCNNYIGYVRHLAKHLGREDLKLEKLSQFNKSRFAGKYPIDVVIDHAARLSTEQRQLLNVIENYATSPAQTSTGES